LTELFSVVSPWTATYPDPITLRAGEAVKLNGKTDEWDGHCWLWAENPAGKAGWVPDSLVDRTSAGYRAVAEYSAIELTCRSGEILRGLDETHGWVLCRSSDGAVGWVPSKNLKRRSGGAEPN